MRLAIVIMAAGKGTRLKSKRPKVLHKIGGKALVEHVIHAATQIVPPQDVYVVVGHQAGAVQAAVTGTGVHFVTQSEQRGTGHAVQTARQAVAAYEHIIVLSGDVPLLQPETIARLRDFHLAERAAMSILTACPSDPHGYGRVIRRAPGAAEVAAIVEQKALTPEQKTIPEINSGIYAFATTTLFQLINELRTDNAHGEYYLTDMADVLVQEGQRVVAIEAESSTEVLGANTLAEMADLDAAMRLTTARKLMAQGVTIYRPETTVIDAGVRVGPDTIIEPFVQLLGETHIGEDCHIRSYSVIENSTIENHVLIQNHCVIDNAHIRSSAQLGPYARLRPGSDIGEEAHIGNFVETKKMRIGKGSKANHLSYLGDAEIGSGVNIGAGTITCNYDGVNKHRTLIEDKVFVGSDTTLVAPIVIGEGSYIAAGSCITEDVPPDALALGRARQTTKPDWARSHRSKR
ncbi:bifunctional UDP-N-acetylglucosamine diphosphorylase/glucosamine-1-phosphate N-acetyltransferase GlmU [Alloacidobacterium dinghuense]|uniref:Bifunctional protein GlmU n=1 Tax=Alloacidobacterium dinghuense TaxID=2763107 RepID=A0A7G8BP96_9BACT|nr:bifunctional UDP-N-acetylglucosamine diphosphorylase/glucosamine-1-phosphate N-acetyltransferase GlmU [Alloacidobacterium dinghuense]QNI34366.1 bifunctional UDP-N-acetylglucosamine diphosphorylase/glucosamine-1-phosphate N-acetyltransferase GlmU [Alloacidobacterium dinghuense]